MGELYDHRGSSGNQTSNKSQSCAKRGKQTSLAMSDTAKKQHFREIFMDVMDRIKHTLAAHPVVLFMKGTPQFPMCGFSGTAVKALKACNAEFYSVNVLEDPEVRANLPQYSDWPTYPQLFVKGELIGGADIMSELYSNGELAKILNDAA
jgi:monothiol glutaredoxin